MFGFGGVWRGLFGLTFRDAILFGPTSPESHPPVPLPQPSPAGLELWVIGTSGTREEKGGGEEGKKGRGRRERRVTRHEC